MKKKWHKPTIGRVYKHFTSSDWFFPVIVLLIVIVLSTFRVSGSSVGEISQQLIDSEEDDSSLIFGHPRNLRSDEWSVNTPFISSQQQNNYALFSTQLGTKNDTTVVSDIPSRDWTVVFKPQNLGFIIGIPFENSFALRWWLMGYVLMISAYFLTLHLFPSKRLFAALIALSLFFAPIIQWWYQNINILVVAYALLSLLFFMKLIDTKKDNLKKKFLYSLSLSWSTIAFALILYPPYQIPIAYITVVAAIAYLISKYRSDLTSLIKENSKYIFLSISIVIVTLGAFYYIHKDALHQLSSTSYPGQRRVVAGDFPITHILGYSLAPLFINENISKTYFPESGLGNSSESSQLGLPLITILVLAISVIIVGIRKRRIMIMTIAMSIITMLILLRLLVPHFNTLYNLTLISTIPHQRMILALGVAMFLLLLVSMYEKSIHKISFSHKELLVINSVNIILTLASFILVSKNLGWMMQGVNPLYLLVLVVVYPVSLGLLFTLRKYTLVALAFLLFTFTATVNVNPLYVGFGASTSSEVSKSIQSISDSDSGKWITDFDKIWQLESLVLLNGAKSLSGVYIYPQNSIWKQIDSSDEAKFAYNRFAHVTFSINSGNDRYTRLKYESAMEFNISTTPCSDFLKEMKVAYILTTSGVASSCSELVKAFDYPKQDIYIYKIINTSSRD